MDKLVNMMQELAKERPVGTDYNNHLLDMLEGLLGKMGYAISSLPFACMVWRKGPSKMTIGEREIAVEPSPFSAGFQGKGPLRTASTLAELQNADCRGAILLLSGALTQEALSPKDYPFYYPEEHKAVIDLLEDKGPAAIIAVTGSSPLHGKDPFPLFEDGNFSIPSANIGKNAYKSILSLLDAHGGEVDLLIDSGKKTASSRQIVASKKAERAKGRIVLAAHMDSKYDTPGALDNAAGLATLLETAASLSANCYDIDILPFNGEEYYGASGEMAYLQSLGETPISLMINIDSPGHKGSKIAISTYNFSESMLEQTSFLLAESQNVERGGEWFAGDHAPFLFRQIPCMAVCSSDFFDGGLAHTHTAKDTLDEVDIPLLKDSALFLTDFLSRFDPQES